MDHTGMWDATQRHRHDLMLMHVQEKNVWVVFLGWAGEAGERLPLGKIVQFCAYLLFVGALAASLSDG